MVLLGLLRIENLVRNYFGDILDNPLPGAGVVHQNNKLDPPSYQRRMLIKLLFISRTALLVIGALYTYRTMQLVTLCVHPIQISIDELLNTSLELGLIFNLVLVPGNQCFFSVPLYSCLPNECRESTTLHNICSECPLLVTCATIVIISRWRSTLCIATHSLNTSELARG